ncbi:hypothetical protein KUCAC02_035129 [Chaenocephalus aceratus]|nr:hypothetical protein KUCAC02_035129 [Chaenocephalus aceratus]
MNDDEKYIVREMKKAIGQANIILSEEKVLMGRRSKLQKSLWCMFSLERCKHEFAETFSDQVCAEDFVQRALLYFSSGYACGLLKDTSPFLSQLLGHLEGGVCFCQYGSQQLSVDQWE